MEPRQLRLLIWPQPTPPPAVTQDTSPTPPLRYRPPPLPLSLHYNKSPPTVRSLKWSPGSSVSEFGPNPLPLVRCPNAHLHHLKSMFPPPLPFPPPQKYF